jgi:tRNA(Leu) C34 or U34 (ribose-2'-O)-methylase TrmL
MVRGLRSLNVIAAGAIVLTEAMRQIGAWEKLD